MILLRQSYFNNLKLPVSNKIPKGVLTDINVLTKGTHVQKCRGTPGEPPSATDGHGKPNITTMVTALRLSSHEMGARLS